MKSALKTFKMLRKAFVIQLVSNWLRLMLVDCSKLNE